MNILDKILLIIKSGVKGRSGSWSGPGQPRFSWSPKSPDTEVQALAGEFRGTADLSNGMNKVLFGYMPDGTEAIEKSPKPRPPVNPTVDANVTRVSKLLAFNNATAYEFSKDLKFNVVPPTLMVGDSTIRQKFVKDFKTWAELNRVAYDARIGNGLNPNYLKSNNPKLLTPEFMQSVHGAVALTEILGLREMGTTNWGLNKTGVIIPDNDFSLSVFPKTPNLSASDPGSALNRHFRGTPIDPTVLQSMAEFRQSPDTESKYRGPIDSYHGEGTFDKVTQRIDWMLQSKTYPEGPKLAFNVRKPIA